MAFQIKDWDTFFENYRSRELEQCSKASLPNKHHGMGLARVLSEPDGAAIFGIFVLMVEAVSQQRKPRDGWLSDNGQPTGRAWTAEDMALKWRRPVSEIERTLEVTASANVAWIIDHEGALSTKHPATTDVAPSSDLRMERTERTEEKERREGVSRVKPRSPSTPKSCDEAYLSELQADEAYTNLNVRQVYVKMVRYCKDQGKQATRRRLLNWLNREDRPMGNANGAAKPNTATGNRPSAVEAGFKGSIT